jgi:hypothetical protein
MATQEMIELREKHKANPQFWMLVEQALIKQGHSQESARAVLDWDLLSIPEPYQGCIRKSLGMTPAD